MSDAIERVAAPQQAAAPKPEASRQSMTRVGLEALFNLVEEWSLDPRECAALLGVSERTISRWRRAVEDGGSPNAFDIDKLSRLSAILGIYRNLHTLFRDPQQANGWIRRANRASVWSTGKSSTSCWRCSRSRIRASRPRWSGCSIFRRRTGSSANMPPWSVSVPGGEPYGAEPVQQWRLRRLLCGFR